MCDKLIFDLAQEVEGSPNVFVRKDWINLLDNQNQNYNSNQSILDTSQIANSNKYVSYREGYLLVPLLITLAKQSTVLSGGAVGTVLTFNPALAAQSADFSIGLKNWFGSMIHSFTLDYNGTTIVQQTPLINMWNSFKLMTTLSYNDVITQGCTIGFFPDSPASPVLRAAAAIDGIGVVNNRNLVDVTSTVSGAFSTLTQANGNEGFLQRQRWISFDLQGVSGAGTYADFYSGAAAPPGLFGLLWKSYISNKSAGADTHGVIQWTVMATIYLKHIHSFFNMCPLIKGAFMKMTMNLNNTTTSFAVSSSVTQANPGVLSASVMTVTSIQSPLNGVNPLMIASATANNGGACLIGVSSGNTTTAGTVTANYKMNISTGAKCLDTTLSSQTGVTEGTLGRSVTLYVPTYQFNPVFEQAYLSSPIKPIKYTDLYQYQVLNIAAGGNFNNLITNGISNIKSVLCIPYFSSSGGASFAGTYPQWQSPFDPAGCGPTSPFSSLTNFNVQISGQNAIYNMEKYSFEQFNNQLYGQNAVNGGLTDGLTSSLIDRDAFDTSYCYYYVNVERMLPVEQAVPKSVQIIGQSTSNKAIDLIVFVEYYNSISIDVLTGARVA